MTLNAMISPEEASEIDRILEVAKASLPPEGPVVLSPEYLRAIELVENLPENRPGTDKSWTERALFGWVKAVRESRLIERDG